MAAAIATIARVSGGRFRACFGTGGTARWALGKRPMTLAALGDYVTVIRRLLAGETALVAGAPIRMLHARGLAEPRPIEVPLWLSVFGPRGASLAGTVADGIIGPPHPTLPAATIVSGTVLDPGEDPRSTRVLEAIGPWRVVDWHTAYLKGGAEAVDAMPGGRDWRRALEESAPEGERHLLTFEGYVTHLPERDRRLLEHIDVKRMVGDATRVGRQFSRLAEAGFQEVIYTPSGPDVARELRAFGSAHSASGPAAVDRNDGAVDERRGVGGEK